MTDMASSVVPELHLQGGQCDVVIKVGDAEFEAHRDTLCSCSLYFWALLSGVWATSKNNNIYTIPGVSPEMMHLIIQYSYNHSVPVTKANVVELLAAADQFLVPGIVQICCSFLENQLCLANCIGIWRLVDIYFCPELQSKTFFYILHHFEEVVCASQELLELSVQQLAAIIENDHLNVRREDTVFEIVLRWMNHLPDQRRCHISVLLSKVRLGLMTAVYLHNSVIDNAAIKDSIECMQIVDNAVTAFMDFRANRGSKVLYNNLLTRPRLPSAILLATGGKAGSTTVTSLEAYDVRADCWVTVSTKICRSDHGVAVINDSVYLVGGCNNDVYLNSVQRFELVTCTWYEVAPMKYCRCYVSVAVQNGCIYAMGGYNGHGIENTVECYKPETDQWIMMAPMCAKRCGASSTTLHGKVYICGGFNGHYIMSTAEYYNPNTNQWTMIACMKCCRSGLGVAAYRGRIYAVGGIVNWTYDLCSAEAYNPQTNTWSSVPSMYSPRSYFGIEVVDDQLFVVGGNNSPTALSTVERYDEEAGMWYSAANINVCRSNLSCCVLHGLYSVAESLFPRGSVMPPIVQETHKLSTVT